MLSTLKNGKYRISKILGQGSFGITYLATTKFQGPLGEISVKVAIKEFFARDLNMRHPDGTVAEVSSGSLCEKYAKDFQREARNLSSLKHPNIINVLEAFSENNTHYYVMEYLDGGNLEDYIQSKGRLSEAEGLDIASQIASALSYMHSHNILHLDLKPRNIMRRGDGSICLIDFGLSKQYESSGEPESSTTIGLGTPGYAPLEQGSSNERKNFAPTLDIYALGASIFKMLTGKTPPHASDIINDGFPSDALVSLSITSKTIRVIEKMMSPRKIDRPQSVEECGLKTADEHSHAKVGPTADYTEILKEEAKEEETIPIESEDMEIAIDKMDFTYMETEREHPILQSHGLKSGRWVWITLSAIGIMCYVCLIWLLKYDYKSPLYNHELHFITMIIILTMIIWSAYKINIKNKLLRISFFLIIISSGGLTLFGCSQSHYWDYLGNNMWRERSLINRDCSSAESFPDNILPISKWGKFGLINVVSGEVIMPYKYDYIDDFCICKEWKLINVSLSGKKGAIDREGNLVIPCIYDEIKLYMLNYCGAAYICKNDKKGLVNCRGEILLPIEYDYVEDRCCDGRIIIAKDGLFGLADDNGNIIAPTIYEGISSSWDDGLWAVKSEGKWGYVNKNNKVVIPFQYKSTSGFLDGIARVTTFDGDEYIINRNGQKQKCDN